MFLHSVSEGGTAQPKTACCLGDNLVGTLQRTIDQQLLDLLQSYARIQQPVDQLVAFEQVRVNLRNLSLSAQLIQWMAWFPQRGE